MMTFAPTTAVTIGVLLLWTTCASVGSAQAKDLADGPNNHRRDHHDHTRTRSATRQHRRTERLTADMPTATLTVGTERTGTDNGGVLNDYPARRPTSTLASLMNTGMNAVKTGMDAIQSMSSRVFRTIRPRRYSDTSNDGGGGRKRSVPVARRWSPDTSIIRSVSKSLVNAVDTGIAGVKQATDLGVLLGNIGRLKLMSGLNGKNGNREIVELLVKYVASRFDSGSQSDPAKQFVGDAGVVSTFLATDDETTKAISTVMARLMDEPAVTAAAVRLAIAVIQSTPSTECLLDRLPLSAKDVRTLFDVFVGDRGQQMMKMVAGMLSELTTGPDTKEFLEALVGMAGMFYSGADGKEEDKLDKPTTSVFGALKNVFTGGGMNDDDDDDDDDESFLPPDEQSMKKWKEASDKSSGGISKNKSRFSRFDDKSASGSASRSGKRGDT